MSKFNYDDYIKSVKEGNPSKRRTAALKAQFEQQSIEQPRGRTEKPRKREVNDIKAIKEKLYANGNKSFSKDYITPEERTAMRLKGRDFGRGAR